jgi:hypothetical protein
MMVSRVAPEVIVKENQPFGTSLTIELRFHIGSHSCNSLDSQVMEGICNDNRQTIISA